MSRLIDRTGKRFGVFTVISRAKGRGHDNGAEWSCLCDCGRRFFLVSRDFYRGKKSCGCLFKELISAAQTTHGNARPGRVTTEYRSWQKMKRRCDAADDKDFHRYGGRGITICKRWRKFENFLKDMGRKPSRIHSIDRINNDGNYEPGNCRWATPKQQARNRGKRV